MLTKNEKLLIADALNGCGTLIEHDPNYVRLMAGDSGAIKDAAVIGRDDEDRVLLTGSTVCSGLEHEIYDHIRLNAADKKWDVDGCNLIHELREMTVAQREKLIRFICELWSRPMDRLNDGSFERDLEALEI
jgi:hypothetical protein